MKFLPLPDLDDINSALNFETPELRVIGGCDIYTTKAAGSDKKLYRNIENSLESQYESLLRLSASVSPPNDSGPSPMNLSRPSPFGPLSQVSSRRTFAYLIATLNASHPDYDFSHILRPTDFRKERSLKTVINTIDSTLYNLRPTSGMTLQVPLQAGYATVSSAPPTTQMWGPQIWSIIDKEMTLKTCSVYCWAPLDEPFDGDEGSIWSLNYFFFNKELKRVAYIYVRGVPVMTHSPRQRSRMAEEFPNHHETGATKRAKYWLGAQAANVTTDEDAEIILGNNNAEDMDLDERNIPSDGDEFYDDYEDELGNESDKQEHKGYIRGVSEDIAASMDIDL